jgi:hypothetical protein
MIGGIPHIEIGISVRRERESSYTLDLGNIIEERDYQRRKDISRCETRMIGGKPHNKTGIPACRERDSGHTFDLENRIRGRDPVCRIRISSCQTMVIGGKPFLESQSGMQRGASLWPLPTTAL